jgi:hypothetical protein
MLGHQRPLPRSSRREQTAASEELSEEELAKEERKLDEA